jgi:hypothetical protein
MVDDLSNELYLLFKIPHWLFLMVCLSTIDKQRLSMVVDLESQISKNRGNSRSERQSKPEVFEVP